MYIRRQMLVGEPGTWKRYEDALNNFLERYKDRHFPDEFHRFDISDYKEIRIREGAKPRTINLELAVLKVFWNWLIERELASFNPVARQKQLKVPEQRPRGLARDIVDKLLSVCADSYERLLVLMPLTTGMRSVELARLEWSDIDWDNNLIHLAGERTKTKKGRTLPLREDVKQILIELKDGRKRYVFHTRAGNPRGLWAKFKRIGARAQIYPNPTLHMLRHTFATMMLRSGLDIFTVQKLMGHADMKTTAIYLCAADNNDVRDKLSLLPS